MHDAAVLSAEGNPIAACNVMNTDVENVSQAKESFNRILDNQKYAEIIKDDNHLSLLLALINADSYHTILDIGTGTGYLAFPLAEKFPTANVCGIDIYS